MPEHLQPPGPASINSVHEEGDGLRILSRSPHPYHRRNFELLELSDTLVSTRKLVGRTSPFSYESTPASGSGTEADDEHFLKRLPAPKARLHKGLRGKSEAPSGSSTPLLSPASLEEEVRVARHRSQRVSSGRRKCLLTGERSRRQKELVRRTTELLLLISLGYCVQGNHQVQPFLRLWWREITLQAELLAALLLLYPVRLTIWAYRQGKPSRTVPIAVPSSFDPAPILYPPVLPIFVSLLVAVSVRHVVLLNLVLSLCIVPRSLIPGARCHELYNALHWLLSCAPIFVSGQNPAQDDVSLALRETLVLLYPLHQELCMILHYLTTTSLLTAELQLLSVALINILILSYSPQVVILKALLWGGGLAILILCGPVIRWGIALARVPKWRFRRAPLSSRGSSFFPSLRGIMLSCRHSRYDIPGTDFGNSTDESCNTSDDDYELHHGSAAAVKRLRHPEAAGADSRRHSRTGSTHVPPVPSDEIGPPSSSRRHSLPFPAQSAFPSKKTHTPSGRRKRSASSTLRYFFSLTQAQAAMRKWIYAGYVYLCMLAIILVGVREYVRIYALSGDEPIGWALGYLFGNLPWFRFQVVKANLERWIRLPPRISETDHTDSCNQGWIQQLRHVSIGEANTRLIITGYWLSIGIAGLAVVFQLSPVCEVDTRRKVFHFMMVAMLLPTTYIDPTFAALALSLVLAIFLLVDLIRASQLPPLSKPIAAFLTPFVDGRDLRGPVVISHIFLLIGCAIPLWLSLAALPRSSACGHLAGWEVPTRDVSMVSGVICVGLGDSAASLIGRRWGHRKWVWGGGKSLEGSAAFAVAVFAGLMAAGVWLRLGSWPSVPVEVGGARLLSWSLWWRPAVTKAGVCASAASLTEAVLTGGNDNVVVPVVLWTCVKSLGL